MCLFFKKKDTSVEEYNERYNKMLNEDINKNQDWLYPIIAVVSMGWIDKGIVLFKDSIFWIFIIAGYVLVILLIILNFYLDINARSKFMHADVNNKKQAHHDYVCRHRFIALFGHSGVWLFFINTLFTYFSYVFSNM